ncbi:GNAT family acetyltransferase, putative [Cordyceps militaris CM01]|uniref:GNAT family acetyltransferase, putative n=1 Tax=Cordyceps militaris (strain CM01) TaxID=983644 RepID=G3J6W2_CORMM|nr:GNAT family acetyltransferase, putative [Cordyceps militaris CM01]EGX96239.1 GNAT family acetyltransferase, putative [Cordyceps militaris CM01]
MTSPLPGAHDPSVVLAVADRDEQRQAWHASHPSWGGGLTLDQYCAREEDLLTTALARDGGLTPWILTDAASGPRRILSSCETLRKRAVVARPDGTLTDVTAHGVASVFTEPACRSRGYAGRMMALLGEELARREQTDPGAAAFSVLFSDIGPTFYANHQWMPVGNTHLEFPVAAEPPSSTVPPAHITELGDGHLAALAARDEQLLRAQLGTPFADSSSTTVRAAILPDLATLRWQYRREDHMLRHFLGRAPRVRGALYTPPPGGSERRVWGLWARSRYGGGADGDPVVTVLHFLRLVVEDEAATADEALAEALAGIMAVARREAAEASCRRIEMWNPSERVRAAFRDRLPQLEGKVVERDTSNLASLRWFGAGSVDNVEWVANERFEWC